VSKDLGTYQYRSLYVTGDEDILILPTDAAFRATCGDSGRCTAYIAVYGFPSGADATYSITASNGLRALENGASTWGLVPPNKYTYFYFEVPGGSSTAPIILTVLPLGLAGTVVDVFAAVKNTRPNTTTAQWRSQQSLGPRTITIDSSDFRIANACPISGHPCRMYVGVRGGGMLGAPNVRFSILATSAGGASALAAGVPQLATVPLGGISYFSFWVPPGNALAGGLEFSITPTLGAADALIYVNNVVNPTSGRTVFPKKECTDGPCSIYSMTDFVWNSASSSLSRREVIISPDDPLLVSGRSYIAAVVSDVGGVVSMQVAYNTSWQALTADSPIQDAVQIGAYKYYRLLLTVRPKHCGGVISRRRRFCPHNPSIPPPTTSFPLNPSPLPPDEQDGCDHHRHDARGGC
jgi:hypothetical protein